MDKSYDFMKVQVKEIKPESSPSKILNNRHKLTLKIVIVSYVVVHLT